jgi:hypothetical protein
MLGPTKSRIQDRRPRVELKSPEGRQWLLIGAAALCASALAGTPPQTQTPPAQTPAPVSQAPPDSPPDAQAPDDDFIEFLGGDDVGDAAWWEFLKKGLPRGKDAPATLPQDAKQ